MPAVDVQHGSVHIGPASREEGHRVGDFVGGLPIRSCGMLGQDRSLMSSGSSSVMSVSMKPGATELTRISRPASSCAE